ncbi:PAS domain S-box protein [Aerosakkonema sp. BLCC-F183]|uniref:PAS domain S-box protein n=1 Tax=Aerosakkonema sp. BLCC-F183 TaxID=3342834 RepID=UPI0035BB7560
MPPFLQSFFGLELSILCDNRYICQPELASLHLASDTLIGLIHYAIAIALALFRQRRRDLPYAGVFTVFAVAIVFSGTTHLMEVWTHWHSVAPKISLNYIYWLSGLLKFFTVLLLFYTLYRLKPIVTKTLALPSLTENGDRTKASEDETHKYSNYIEDTVERKEAVEKLETANQTLQTLIEASPLAITTINMQGKVTVWNPAAEKLFGWSKTEVLDKFIPIIPAGLREEFALILEAEFKGKPQTALELRRKRKDGSLVDISLWTAPFFDSNGVVAGSIGLFIDISDKVRAEQALRESQKQLMGIIDNSPAVIFVKDTESRYTLINRRFETLFHVDREGIKGKTCYDIYPREIADKLRENDLRVLAAGTAIENEEVVPQDDGLHTYISVKFPLYNSSDKPYGICAIATDITERKRIEAALRESEEQFRATFEQAEIGIGHCGLNGQFIKVNKSFCDILGYTEEQLLKLSFEDITHPDDVMANLTQFRSLLAGEISTYSMENRYLTRLDRIVWVNLTVSLVRSFSGEPKYVIAAIQDINDRKEAESELKKSLKELSDLKLALDRAAIVAITNRQGKITYVNDKFCALSQYSQEELIGQDHKIINSGYHSKDFFQGLWSTIKSGKIWEGDIKNKAKDGSFYWVKTTIVPLLGERGKASQFLAIRFDITDRKRTEEDLVRSEAKFRELATREALLNRLASQIRSSLDINIILETAVTEVRDLLQIDRCLFLWYRPGDPRHNMPVPQEEKEGSWEVVQEARNLAFPTLLERKIHVMALGPLTTKTFNKEITRIDSVRNLTDRTERKFFFSVGYTALLAFPIHTTSGEIGLLSCSHSSGSRPWRDAEVELLQAVADQLAIAIDQAELYKQTRTAAVKAQEQATKLEQTLHELQQTQAQLVQSEKMSSLGQMVAGVAHEINNPVNFIYGNITPAKEYVADLLDLLELYRKFYPNPVKEIQEQGEEIDLDFIKEDLPKIFYSMKMGADRIRQIVLSLRNFSRLDEAEMKAVDIHEGLDSTLLILQSRLKAKPNIPEIQVIKNYGKLPKIQCYAGQLNQVFMNILNNAIDALEQPSINEDRSINITTELKDSERAIIRIADNGPGMTEEVRQRVFDPFFTTKPVGSGTGLGMSISYQIIDKHSGKLTCISVLGEGAEFAIEIPVSQQR